MSDQLVGNLLLWNFVIYKCPRLGSFPLENSVILKFCKISSFFFFILKRFKGGSLANFILSYSIFKVTFFNRITKYRSLLRSLFLFHFNQKIRKVPPT